MPSLEKDLNTYRIYGGGLSLAQAERVEQEETEEGLSPQTTGDDESVTEGEQETTETTTPIDLSALAEQVYRLFKQELILERERSA